MTSSPADTNAPFAQDVRLTEDSLVVDLVDGRSVTVPVCWYPRLARGTVDERANWRLTGQGYGIHWPDLDEDVAVEDLLAGRRSGESHTSLERWLEERAARASGRTAGSSTA